MDAWIDGRMHGYGWSRPNHMPSHLDAIQTMVSVDLRRLAGDFHSVAQQASFRVAFRRDFRGFWRPTWGPKFDFPAFFFGVFLMWFLHRFLIDFWRLETLKIKLPPRREHYFCKIEVFEKKYEKIAILAQFLEANTEEILSNIAFKKMCFFDIDF